MGKKAPSAPAAPDPVATSQAQAAANADTARLQAQLNRVNQYGPYTNITYTNQGQDWVNQELAKRRQAYDANPGQWVEGSPTAISGLGSAQQNGGYWATYGDGAEVWMPSGSLPGASTSRVWQPGGSFDEAAVRAELEKSNPFRDQWSQHTTFTPEGQAAFDREVALNTQLDNLALSQTQRISGILGQPFTLNGLPQAQTSLNLQRYGGAPAMAQLGNENYEVSRQRVEQALLDRMRPQQQQDRSALETQLLNSGFSRGTEGWDRASLELGQRENDARMTAILAGGQEQTRLQDMDLSRLGFNNAATQQDVMNARSAVDQSNQVEQAGALFGQSARERAIQEQLLLRNQPINEIGALMSGGQVSVPQFSAIPQTGVSPTDVQGAYDRQYQGQLAQYQAQNQRSAGMMGGLFGLGGAALGGWATGGFKL